MIASSSSSPFPSPLGEGTALGQVMGRLDPLTGSRPEDGTDTDTETETETDSDSGVIGGSTGSGVIGGSVTGSGWARSFGLADGPVQGRTQRRPPIMMIWTAVFSAIAILVALTVWTMQLQGPTIVPSGGATVPSVIGLSVADATKRLTDLGFTVEHRPGSDAATGAGRGEPGTVQSSNPAAGFVAPEGTHVELYVVPEPEPAPSAAQSPSASPPASPPRSATVHNSGASRRVDGAPRRVAGDTPKGS